MEHPLQNPNLSELEQLLPALAKPSNQKKVNNQQPYLPIKRGYWQGLRQDFADIWARIKLREAEIELMPFWRSMAAPFAITSAALVVLGMFLGGMIMFNRLGPTVPFYYNAGEARWEQADKLVLLLVPILLFVIEAVIIRLIQTIFLYDRRLSVMLSWTLTLLNTLIMIATIQVYSLSL